MRLDQIEDSQYWTAESIYDLVGWNVIHAEPWTEAVSRLHCYRMSDTATAELRMIYCRTSLLREAVKRLIVSIPTDLLAIV